MSNKKGTKQAIEHKDNQVAILQKVILENFLSFQRDEIELSDSKFVIIIGPNWSGKTSIFQAIKFALGSNARDERYSKWSDFIRHGQNHAIVELHIKSGKELVKIRRSVIKGQSPTFSMQKPNSDKFVKVNAKNIQDLLKSFNYNPDNLFAFVSQGKIDLIKNLKPRELCEFLEEGIGLSDLRREIIRQKEKVLELSKELNALKTRKNTLNLTLELLKPQLEKLEKKHQLLKVRRDFEDELLWANRKKILEEIVQIAEVIKKIEVKVNNLEEVISEEVANLQIYKSKINEIDEDLSLKTEDLGRLKYKKEEYIEKVESWKEDKIRFKEEINKIEKEFNAEKEIEVNYQYNIEKLEKDKSSITSEIGKLENEFDDLIKEQAKLSKVLEENQKLIEEYNNYIKSKTKLEKEFEKNEEYITELNREINQIFQSVEDIEHKLKQNQWFLDNPTPDLLKKIDIRIEKLRVELFDYESNIKELEIEKNKRFRNLNLLRNSLRERKVILPTSINILVEEINKRELSVKGPIINFLKYDDSLSYTIESILGERVLYSFIASDWDTAELLNKIKEKFNAYCNIYVPKDQPISKFPKISSKGVIGYIAELIGVSNDDEDIKKVIYSKVKNCIVVDNYIAAKHLYLNEGFKGKCVTLKGKQIVSYKYVYETPFVKKLKGLLSTGTQKEQSKRLEKEIEELNQKLLINKEKAKQIDTEQKQLYKQKQGFNDLYYSFNQRVRLTSKKNEIYEKRNETEKQNEIIKSKIRELNQKIETLKQRAKPEIFQISEKLRKIPTEINQINEDIKQWKLKLKENSDDLKSITIKLDTIKEKINKLKASHTQKMDQFKEADQAAFNIFRDLGVIENDIVDITTKIKTVKEQKDEIINNRENLREKHMETQFALKREEMELNTYEFELEKKNSEIERISEKLEPLIEKESYKPRALEKIQEDLQNLDRELLKFYDVDDSILVEKEQTLYSLKSLTKNQVDLESDIESALKAEDKMELTFYDKFKVVLTEIEDLINKKFKQSKIKVYCSIGLIGEFETLGVDIKASVSKDRMVSCSALSGGQISMISICLILALQEIRATSLCMLDEAAMFLDDKNSEITYQLIKSTLNENPIQMMLFLPKAPNSLFLLADKLIGVARIGKEEISTIFKPKIIHSKE